MLKFNRINGIKTLGEKIIKKNHNGERDGLCNKLISFLEYHSKNNTTLIDINTPQNSLLCIRMTKTKQIKQITYYIPFKYNIWNYYGVIKSNYWKFDKNNIIIIDCQDIDIENGKKVLFADRYHYKFNIYTIKNVAMRDHNYKTKLCGSAMKNIYITLEQFDKQPQFECLDVYV